MGGIHGHMGGMGGHMGGMHGHMRGMGGVMGRLGLTHQEIDDIVAFLQTLSDGYTN